MCGIVGFNWEDKKLIRKMASKLSHRGPDDEGYFTDRGISLGHKRLKIIDLTEKGRQPIHNEENTIFIVYNGEVYNFKALREELQTKGHKFYSNTDTEVIVHLYEEHGEKCLNYLNGSFAIAIWDRINKKLFLARDRLGMKPLYYTIIGKKLIFASEIKAILEFEDIKREVNIKALHDYLSYRCNSLAETMFKKIYKLLPGQYLILKNKKLYLKKYWNLKFEPINYNENYLKKLIYRKLESSVKLRLMSEVPLGAFISGGIDSSTIAYFMSKLNDEPVKTFSVGFGLDEDYDELKYAKQIADYFKTDHREIIVKPDTVNVLPKIVWHLDEPMADPTSIPIYLLSGKIKKYATVALTGDGGDEAFGGYAQVNFMRLHKRYIQKIPLALRKAFPPIVKIMPKKTLNKLFKYSSELGQQGIKRFSNFLLTNNTSKSYLNLVSIFNEEEKKELYSNNTKKKTAGIDYYRELNKEYFSDKNKNYINQIMKLDTEKILAENMLMKADKNSMAFAVEQRAPFLDHTLLNFSATIRPELKIKHNQEKYILRKAMHGYVPKQILKRKKSRFFVPINRWFSGELMELTKQLLSEENIKKQGFFDYKYINKIFRNYNNSRLFYSRQLWTLLCFELWHKIYIDKIKLEKVY